MFDDIKNYFSLDNGKKTCTLCGNNPLITYTQCDGCQKYFCLNHRPMFQKTWFCPICEKNFSQYLQPLQEQPVKQSSVSEFFKKLF